MAITSNVNLVRKKVVNLSDNVEVASRRARDEMANLFKQLAQDQIKGQRPKGQRATAGKPPMNRTGNLRNNIEIERSQDGLGGFYARVGPTMVYARAVELGGQYAPKSWRNSSAIAGFPFMAPAFVRFQRIAPSIIRKHFGGTT